MLEVVMPCLREFGFVLSSDVCDAVQLGIAESILVRHSDRREPELRELAIAFHMDMDWLASIAREEEKSVGAAFRTVGLVATGLLPAFSRDATRKSSAPRRTLRLDSPAATLLDLVAESLQRVLVDRSALAPRE